VKGLKCSRKWWSRSRERSSRCFSGFRWLLGRKSTCKKPKSSPCSSVTANQRLAQKESRQNVLPRLAATSPVPVGAARNTRNAVGVRRSAQRDVRSGETRGREGKVTYDFDLSRLASLARLAAILASCSVDRPFTALARRPANTLISCTDDR
jgi:hypothetical protein